MYFFKNARGGGMIKGRLCGGCNVWLSVGGDCYYCLTTGRHKQYTTSNVGDKSMYEYKETKKTGFILVHEQGTNKPTYVNLDKIIHFQGNMIATNYGTFFCRENVEEICQLIAEAE